MGEENGTRGERRKRDTREGEERGTIREERERKKRERRKGRGRKN